MNFFVEEKRHVILLNLIRSRVYMCYHIKCSMLDSNNKILFLYPAVCHGWKFVFAEAHYEHDKPY